MVGGRPVVVGPSFKRKVSICSQDGVCVMDWKGFKCNMNPDL